MNSRRKPHKPLIDLSGRRFGNWIVLHHHHAKQRPVGWFHFWMCKCACGTEKTVLSSALRYGTSLSCGCLRKALISKNRTTHGDSRSAEFSVWKGILERCYNKRFVGYQYYGGRGITVCDSWRNSYSSFLKDMGRRPSAKHSIDRIDSSAGYAPGNCRWVDSKTQARNRRSNTRLFFKGETHCIAGWSELTGISPNAISMRLRSGWTVHETLTTPVRNQNKAP